MVTLKQLMSIPELHSIDLAAGAEGMVHPVEGVNVTESVELAAFFRPSEFIVTTGINMSNLQQLLEMVESAYEHNAAGVIINIGPYIQEIPQEVLDFGDGHGFPIFSMPWEFRIADLLKITIQFLSAEQNKQKNMDNILSEILFNENIDLSYIKDKLTNIGFDLGAESAIIVCTSNAKNKKITSFLPEIEEKWKQRYKFFLSMVSENEVIYLINRSALKTPQIPIAKVIHEILENSKGELYMGLGNFYKHILELKKSYQEGKKVIQLNKRLPHQLAFTYKDLGAYQLILGIHDQEKLEAYSNQSLGPLYRYDRLRDTNYIEFLRVYLEEDGQTSKIAKKGFVHRNTVLYKIKKIESILDIDLSLPFSKMNLSLAFMIEDLRKGTNYATAQK